MSIFDWVLIGVVIGVILFAGGLFGLYKLGRAIETRNGVKQAEQYANTAEAEDL